MPSSYTAPIQEGEEGFKPEDFILRCARSVCAFVHQRGQSLSSENKLRKPDEYYQKKNKELKSQLSKLISLSEEEIIREFNEYRAEKIKYYNESIEEKKEIKKRYSYVLNFVEKWEPPTEEHVHLKEFALNQLNESIRFDIGYEGDDCYFKKSLSEIKNTNPFQWHYEKISDITSSISRNYEEIEKENKRCDQANSWISELYTSLGLELPE